MQVGIGFLHMVVKAAHAGDAEHARLLGLPGLDEADVDTRRTVGMQVQRIGRDVVRTVVLIDERHPAAGDIVTSLGWNVLLAVMVIVAVSPGGGGVGDGAGVGGGVDVWGGVADVGELPPLQPAMAAKPIRTAAMAR